MGKKQERRKTVEDLITRQLAKGHALEWTVLTVIYCAADELEQVTARAALQSEGGWTVGVTRADFIRAALDELTIDSAMVDRVRGAFGLRVESIFNLAFGSEAPYRTADQQAKDQTDAPESGKNTRPKERPRKKDDRDDRGMRSPSPAKLAKWNRRATKLGMVGASLDQVKTAWRAFKATRAEAGR